MKLILVLLLSISTGHVAADNDVTTSDIESYRCGNKLIQRGMQQHQAVKACGSRKPAHTKRWTRSYSNGFTTWYRNFEAWIFQPYGKFDVWVVFDSSGEVIDIYQTNQRN